MLVLAAVICSYYLSPSFHLNEIWQPLMDEIIRQDSYEDQITWMIFPLVIKHGWNTLHLLRWLCRWLWLPPWFRLENPQQTWLGLGKIKGLDCRREIQLGTPSDWRKARCSHAVSTFMAILWLGDDGVGLWRNYVHGDSEWFHGDFMVISWWLRDSTASETGIWLEEIVAASILETEMI